MPTPLPVIDSPVLQNPLLPDAGSLLPPGANLPKPTKSSNPLVASPNEGGDTELPNLSEPRPVMVGAASAFGAPGLPIGELPRTDPIARAARYNAVTPAESMVDGLGGTAMPLGSAFEATPLSNLSSSRKRFRFGPINLIGPSLNVGLSDGSFTNHGNQSNGTSSASNQGGSNGTEGFQSTSGLSFGLILGEPATGHYMTLEYGGIYEYPTNNGSGSAGGGSNTQPFNQSLTLLGEMDFSRLTLGFGISYAGLSGTNRDLGGDANRQLLQVALTSSYALTAKSSLDWDLSLPVRQVSGGIGSAGFTSSTFINHRFNDKLKGGIGVVGGIENEQGSNAPSSATSGLLQGTSTQKYEQALVDINLVPSPRVTLLGTCGAELRDAGGTRSVNPIFSLSAAWSPRTGTSIFLTGNESTQSSANTAGENFTSTSFNLSASQRLGSRMNLLLSIGYEHAAYQSTQSTPSTTSAASATSTAPGTNSNRVDNLLTAQAGVSLNLTRGWSASISYIYTDDRSNTDGFTSSRGQIQVGYTF